MRASGLDRGKAYIPRVQTLAALLLLVPPAVGWAQPVPPPGHAAVHEDEGAATAATLTFWNRPVVVFRATFRQAGPAERAARAARRIEALPDDLRRDEIRAEWAMVGDLKGIIVFARNHALFGLLPEDLDLGAGETLETASRQAVERLQLALEARAQQRRLPVLLRGIGASLVAMLLLALVFWAIGRAYRWGLTRFDIATRGPSVQPLGAHVVPFLSSALRVTLKVAAWGLCGVAAYLWLAFVLRRFPYSRPWGDQLRGFLAALLADLGTGALRAIPGLFAVLVIFLATRFATRMVDGLLRAVEQGGAAVAALDSDTAKASRRVIAVVLWLFALTVAYPYIPGSDTEAFKAIGVFAGLMISLGSAGLVNQVMSGLVVIYSRALRPGEVVRAGETVGLVSEVGFLSTRIITPRREAVTIPNAVLAGTTVTNYSRLAGDDGAIVSTPVTIGYDAPWRQVHALLLLAAERTAGTRAHPRPYVVQQALSDFSVEYELRVHLERAEDRFRVLSELHGQIQDAFNEFGVQIMSPAFESQPDKPVVVPRSQWHAAPAARSSEAGQDRTGPGLS